MIACPPVIVAAVFEMLKEPQDLIECKRVKSDLSEPARHISRDESEKQTQYISIGFDGGRPETFLQREFVGEECVKQGPERGRTHDITFWMSGSAQRSNRWLASVRRSVVIVR
jgi:hypothetical protein